MSLSMQCFIKALGDIVSQGGTEKEMTAKVAARLAPILVEPNLLPPDQMAMKDRGYAMYPVHVAEDGRFSIAAMVLDVGQVTPIHDHGTWGVIGIYKGAEHEERFLREESVPLDQPAQIQILPSNDVVAGHVHICCTSDKDIHRVSCGTDEPCVGIHVYGADIGTMQRHSYNLETGIAKSFVSGWDQA